VDAPVTDPFRPPPQPWLPGNRGIEYGTALGAPVTAIGPGIVAFAGPVAGRLVVAIRHPDGLRSTYTGLWSSVVAAGDAVEGGDLVGYAAGPLHLGVRRGRTYLDPASLWGRSVARGHPILVPDRPSGGSDQRRPPAGRVGSAGGGAVPLTWLHAVDRLGRLWW
jgi:murein DD-endopeptidase MepM/ murein hydrolase activator NlpD